MSHADTIRNYIIVSHSTEKLTASALAAVDEWEAEDAQMQGYDHLQMVEVSELRAEVRRLQDALERIAESQPDYGPVTKWHEACIAIADAALVEEADRG